MKTGQIVHDEDGKNQFSARKVGEVLKDWPHMHYDHLPEAKKVILRGMWPPINDLDDSLQLLEECVTLSLSKNMIEKISHLEGLINLKVLSLAQNNIKSLNGLESISNTLEVLIIARNFIKETKGVEDLNKLKELDISYNYISQPTEFSRIASCKNLKSLGFKENPLAKRYPDHIWREEALKVLPELEFLDYIKVAEHERCIIQPISEIFKLKENILINEPQYMIYNEMFRKAMEEVLQSKHSETAEEEEFYSSHTLLSV